jgi:hypothetical protein
MPREPPVLGSRNGKIQTGELGNLDGSRAIPVLDIPTTKVDRSMGECEARILWVHVQKKFFICMSGVGLFLRLLPS